MCSNIDGSFMCSKQTCTYTSSNICACYMHVRVNIFTCLCIYRYVYMIRSTRMRARRFKCMPMLWVTQTGGSTQLLEWWYRVPYEYWLGTVAFTRTTYTHTRTYTLGHHTIILPMSLTCMHALTHGQVTAHSGFRFFLLQSLDQVDWGRFIFSGLGTIKIKS